jgi:transposase
MIPLTKRACRQVIKQQCRRITELETQVADLTAKLAQRDAVIARLEQQVAELSAQVARLSKNSSTSSKPPSSDIVKPPKTSGTKGGKRRLGGQPGHRRHERQPFSPEEVDEVVDYRLPCCPDPDCGGAVRTTRRPPETIQQIEIPKTPARVIEHRGHACQCLRCGQVFYAPLPPEVEKAGLIGPRLTAQIAYLKGACHASFSTLRKYCRDVLGVTVSRGQLAKVVNKVSVAMAPAYEELAAMLPDQPRLNVDETGHKENGKPHWTWCFRADLYTLFKIDPSRGSDVLVTMLGEEFDGVLGCDYFSAYRKYMRECDIVVQFCLAHLIRDVKFLTTLTDKVTAAYGQRVLEGLRRLFHVIHRRQTMNPERFQRALEKARDELVAVGKQAPQRNEAQNMANRFRQHGQAYFQFVTTPRIEPTNNLAEQAIRFVVLDRIVTQGTRSEKGRRWCERIWTAIATCTQQGRSVFEYIHDTVMANLRGNPVPSLLPVASG